MAKNLEELKAENPELAESIMAEANAAVAADVTAATEAERQRLREIDSIASVYDDAIVNDAKYGDSPCTAQEMAFRAAQKAAQQGVAFLADLNADGMASGAGAIAAAPAPEEAPRELSPDERRTQGRADARALNKKE